MTWRDFNANRLEDLTWFADVGYDLNDATRSLGITGGAIWRWCERHGHLDLYDRLAERRRRHDNQYTRRGVA